jgi:hypothetical protein
MIFNQSYVFMHENLFIIDKFFQNAKFDWDILPYIEKLMKYISKNDGIYYFIYVHKYEKLIKEVIERYEIPFELIKSEKEVKAISTIDTCKYYKKRDNKGLSLNPIMVSSLGDVCYDIEHNLL